MLGTCFTRARLNVVAACCATGNAPNGSNCPANISAGYSLTGVSGYVMVAYRG